MFLVNREEIRPVVLEVGKGRGEEVLVSLWRQLVACKLSTHGRVLGMQGVDSCRKIVVHRGSSPQSIWMWWWT